MPSPIKLIIFDLDGTLIDSLDDLTDAVNVARGEFDLPALSRAEVRSMVGEGARRLMEKALPGLSEEELERALSVFLRYNHDHIADRTVLYPGVRETLAELQRRGFLLTVVSNKTAHLCRNILQVLDADHFFADILGADSLPERKPSPEPLRHVMRLHNVSAAETMMVGDSINDIAAGVAAGVTVVGCTWGYGDAPELAGSHFRVDSFSLLLDLPVLAPVT